MRLVELNLNKVMTFKVSVRLAELRQHYGAQLEGFPVKTLKEGSAALVCVSFSSRTHDE